MTIAAQFISRGAPLALASALAILAGCAGLPAQTSGRDATATLTASAVAAPTAENCRRWYEALDKVIRDEGVSDASAARLAGFPFLRADRFSASFRDELDRKSASAAATNKQAALLDYLRDTDLEARRIELGNLPVRTRQMLGLPASPELALLLDSCSTAQRDAAFSGPAAAEARAQLFRQLVVPDRYADWKRTLGVYPLTSVPFLRGVQGWQRETTERFALAADRQPASATRYMPAIADSMRSTAALRRFAASPRDALGVPQLDADDWSALLLQYAPVFDVEGNGKLAPGSDRFGALRLNGDGPPIVDITMPVAYQRIAFTRYRGQTLTQLVYTIWFPERPAEKAIDLLAGRLDGVMLRITLDQNGAPLLVDSIHACGCYHLFFPTPRLTMRPAPREDMEWAFAPISLPALAAGQRLQLKLESASHYLIGIRPFDGETRKTDMRYRMRNDNELRALPLPGGGTRSAFDGEGIVAGSERGERWLFWPMGIASPGAMRQWGTQATAFVGRRHFDDADLLELRFEIKPE